MTRIDLDLVIDRPLAEVFAVLTSADADPWLTMRASRSGYLDTARVKAAFGLGYDRQPSRAVRRNTACLTGRLLSRGPFVG